MSDLVIRPARPEDLETVSQLWVKYERFHQEAGLAFEATLDRPDQWLSSFERTLGRFSFLWVAEENGRLFGFLLARLKRAAPYLGGVMVGEISDVFVDVEFRRKGAGRLLVETALQDLAKQNLHSIELQVMVHNEEGTAFWNALGFKPELLQMRRMERQE